MSKKSIENSIKELRKDEHKKKFSQSFDLIVNLKDLNLKNPDEQVEFFVTLTHALGKKITVAALAGPEMEEKAKGVVDLIIAQKDFELYKDKKKLKKVAEDYDYFIAQADIMPKVAQVFGRVLGPKGKMPNPKLGSVLPGKAQIEPLYAKLQKTVKISAKKAPVIQVKIGTEAMKDEEIIENIVQVYNQIIHHTPKEKANVKNVLLKLTMSKPVKLDI